MDGGAGREENDQTKESGRRRSGKRTREVGRERGGGGGRTVGRSGGAAAAEGSGGAADAERSGRAAEAERKRACNARPDVCVLCPHGWTHRGCPSHASDWYNRTGECSSHLHAPMQANQATPTLVRTLVKLITSASHSVAFFTKALISSKVCSKGG